METIILKLALISDAWRPQINGVVTTLINTTKHLEEQGYEIELITPERFRNWPCPTYPTIRLAIGCGKRLTEILDEFKPGQIHIATEGPLGLAAWAYCLKRKLPFTTSFHTLFPEYVNLRFRIPVAWGYSYMRWFHAPAYRVMIATTAVERNLEKRGFRNMVRWSRGVDTSLYHPREKNFLSVPRPIFMYVGRVAIEKSIEDFLKENLPGSKLVVGGFVFLIGLVTFPLRLPIGLPLMVIGLSILLRASFRAKRILIHASARNKTLGRALQRIRRFQRKSPGRSE